MSENKLLLAIERLIDKNNEGIFTDIRVIGAMYQGKGVMLVNYSAKSKYGNPAGPYRTAFIEIGEIIESQIALEIEERLK